MEKILVIDDNNSFLTDTSIILKKYFEVYKASNGKKALDYLNKEKISAVLLDLMLPDIEGIDLLKKIKKEFDPLIPVIIISEFGNVSIAIDAIKQGAIDFIQKDFNLEILTKKIIDSLQKNKLELENTFLKNELYEQFDKFIFSGKMMQKINLEITRHSLHNEHVLLCGETGTGKDLIAYEIHSRSKRNTGLFLTAPINSLNETLLESELFGHEKGAFTGADIVKIGMFEAADKGTIYIPEISDLNERIQIKLLDFMQNKVISRVGSGGKKVKLDVRIIMASNKNLADLVKKNTFRSDLYYRISPFTLNIPPLRERKEDIRYLTEYFIGKFSRQYHREGLRVHETLLPELENYPWKGNIRELRGAVMHAILYAENNITLTRDNFPCLEEKPELNVITGDLQGSYKAAEINFKREYFGKLLQQTGGNKTKAAEIAGITRQGMAKILHDIGLE